MKRFYCTVCNKVIRVRKMPRIIESSEDTMPQNRRGVCNFHAIRGPWRQPNEAQAESRMVRK